MKWITRFLIITAAIFLGANTVQAAPVQWEFDQAHSNVFFRSPVHIYSTARGTFPDISGTFVVDEEKTRKQQVRPDRGRQDDRHQYRQNGIIT